MRHALEDEPLATGTVGLVLRFWRLLQGEPTPWALVLVELARERLLQEQKLALSQEREIVLLEQLQSLLEGRPTLRLQTLVQELREKVPPSSLLAWRAGRISQLARAEASDLLDETLMHLSCEVHRLGAQAADLEEHQRLADLRWLLALGYKLYMTPEKEQLLLLYQVLVDLCRACHQDELGNMEATFALRLMQVLREGDEELHLLSEFRSLLESLPEAGPQPPRADPRLTPCWRFRLLRELLIRLLRLDELREEEAAGGEKVPPFALVAHVLQTVRCVLDAWLFPPQGYFRDDYNDTCILWVATGAFWPVIADQLTEPLNEELRQRASWLIKAEEITAQIPLTQVRDLSILLQENKLRLPSAEQLTRWGKQTIHIEEQGPYELSAWYAYFEQRRRDLLAFLEQAIARQEPILCSL